MAQRLGICALDNVVAYLSILHNSEEEQDALVDLLVVPETWFFRDRQPFVYLQTHVAQKLPGVSSGIPLRLLSAPCSSGEEPYSMAMTLVDLGIPISHFRIDAIDICKPSIRKARTAIYTKHSFRGVSQTVRCRHFQAVDDGFTLNPAIANLVTFQHSNLMKCLEDSTAIYDVIFCRNLLIYLEDKSSNHLMESIAGLLKPGGLLVVGSAEMGKVPATFFHPVRESFVFGFERRSSNVSELTLSKVLSDGKVTDNSTTRRSPLTRPASLPRARVRRLLQASLSSPVNLKLPLVTTFDSTSDSITLELELCQSRLQLDPTDALTYQRMADVLIQLQMKQEALECLQKSLYLQPQSQEVLNKLIVVSRDLNQLELSQRFSARLKRLKS